MQYRTLGKTGLAVSVVGVGTWQYGGEWGKQFEQAEVDAILDRSAELGVNLIDTAECYGDHLSEALIGSYLQRRKREDWVVATKFGHHFHAPFERTTHWDAADVLGQLDASLRALKTDYIDVYQFHSGDDAAFDNDELWTTLGKQVEAGKIRHLGISIGSNRNIHQTGKATQAGAAAIQVVYNRIDREPEREVFPSCIEQNLGVLARVPLASGFLTGKYAPGASFAAGDVRNRLSDEQLDTKLRLAEHVRQTEVPAGMDMAVWALAWCLKHPAVTSVIPGCKTPQQAEANAKAAAYISANHRQSATKP